MQSLWYILVVRRLRRLAQRYPALGRFADRAGFWVLAVAVPICLGGIVIGYAFQ